MSKRVQYFPYEGGNKIKINVSPVKYFLYEGGNKINITSEIKLLLILLMSFVYKKIKN